MFKKLRIKYLPKSIEIEDLAIRCKNLTNELNKERENTRRNYVWWIDVRDDKEKLRKELLEKNKKQIDELEESKITFILSLEKTISEKDELIKTLTQELDQAKDKLSEAKEQLKDQEVKNKEDKILLLETMRLNNALNSRSIKSETLTTEPA
jgi:hypothetical protein